MQTKAQKEYSQAFNGEVADETKDAVVGDMAAEGAQESPDVAMVIDPADAVAGGDQPAEGGEVAADEAMDIIAEAQGEGEPVAEEAAEMASPEGGVDDGAMSPEDIQRQKSWEGRLKKREEELAAREAAVGSAPQEEMIGDAEIEDIKQRLSDDFGDEFVGMISKLAAYEAKKLAGESVQSAIAPVSGAIDEVIEQMREAFAKQHFQTIADAHEDWLDVANSAEFQGWLETLEAGEQEQAQAVIDNGTTGQVIKLLTKYKEAINNGSAEESSEMDELADALDAAGGVRGSAPVSLPSRAPVGDDDEYKSAWASR